MNDYFNPEPIDPRINERFDEVALGFEKLPPALPLIENRWYFARASGSADAIEIVLPVEVETLTTGLGVRVQASWANDGPVTLSLNEIASVAVVSAAGLPLTEGQIVAETIYDLVFDGTAFRLTASTSPAMSPAQLLEALLTVDGAGSGLDTDLVQGTAPSALGLALLGALDAETALGVLDLAELPAAPAIRDNRWFFAVAGGSADALTADLLAELNAGTSVRIKITETNIGPVTLALGAAEPKPLVDWSGNPLAAGALQADSIYDFIFDGSSFRLLTPLPITASEALEELRTVDGRGSGLDSDLLRGVGATDFALEQLEVSSAAEARVLIGLGGIAAADGLLGIGLAEPSYGVDLVGNANVAERTIAISGLPTIYLPDQGAFAGSLAIGDGLRQLTSDTGAAGKNNLAFGIGAGSTLGTGHYNLLIGPLVGSQMTDSSVVNTYGGGLGNVGNVGIGMGVFQVANGALDNTAVGVNSQQNLTTGMDNASIGINALRDIRGGSENVALGHGALQHLVGSGTFAAGYGHRNTAVGDMAGRFLDGGLTNKTGGKTSVYVGAQTQSSGNSVENENVFGYAAKGRGSNTVVYGSTPITSHYFPGGDIFVEGHSTTTAEPNAVIDPVTGRVRRSTGKWATDWNPTFTADSGSFATVTTNRARYKQRGEEVHFILDFTIVNAGTAAGEIRFTLPVPAVATAAFTGFENQVTGQSLRVGLRPADLTAARINFFNSGGSVIGPGRRYIINGFYETTD